MVRPCPSDPKNLPHPQRLILTEPYCFPFVKKIGTQRPSLIFIPT
jgi:hypothetical protein